MNDEMTITGISVNYKDISYTRYAKREWVENTLCRPYSVCVTDNKLIEELDAKLSEINLKQWIESEADHERD